MAAAPTPSSIAATMGNSPSARRAIPYAHAQLDGYSDSFIEWIDIVFDSRSDF
jgi:hypothetical protein